MIKRLLKVTGVLVLAVFFATQIMYSSSGFGNQLMSFKDNPVSLGMANSVLAVENGENSAEFNPAAINGTLGRSLAFNYASWFENIAVQQVLAGLRVNEKSAIGINVNSLNSGSIKSINNSGVYTGETYNDVATSVGLTLGWSFDSLKKYRISGIGITGKYITERYENEKSQNMLADAGLMVKIENNNKSRLGIAVRNVGTKPKFITEENTPTVMGIGLSRWFFNDESLLVSMSSESQPYESVLSAGCEYRMNFGNQMWGIIRGGYSNERKDIGSDATLNAGFGFMWENFGINYAFKPSSLLGDINVVEFRYQFKPKNMNINLTRHAKVQEIEELEVEAQEAREYSKGKYEQMYILAEQARDRALYAQGIANSEIEAIDKIVNEAKKYAKTSNFDDAIRIINDAYIKFNDLQIKLEVRAQLAQLSKEEPVVEETSRVTTESTDETGAKTVKLQKDEVIVKKTDPRASYRKGLQNYLKGNHEDAVESLEAYIKTGDQRYRQESKVKAANAYFNLGMGYYNQGNIEKASSNWRRGKALDPSNKPIESMLDDHIAVKCNEYFSQGVKLYSEDGDNTGAEKLWNKCLKLDPKYEKARKAIARLR